MDERAGKPPGKAPAMKELITGSSRGIPIDQSRANSIAVFAFKTSIILDRMAEKRDSFFPRSVRFAFKESLSIPHENVSMWFASHSSRTGGAALSLYHALPAPTSFELYVCNFRAGHFVFQVVAFKKPF